MCCSGHGKNGALCVLQQSIRPEIITQVCTHTLVQCIDLKIFVAHFGLLLVCLSPPQTVLLILCFDTDTSVTIRKEDHIVGSKGWRGEDGEREREREHMRICASLWFGLAGWYDILLGVYSRGNGYNTCADPLALASKPHSHVGR